MRYLPGIAVAGLASGLCVGAIPARADAPPDAIALFEQGIKDLQAGNTELACRELAASLGRYADSGTKGALAGCYTRLGKVASAWKLWKDLAETAPVELRAEAATNASQLEPRLPRYRIRLADPATGIAVMINGVRVADPTLVIALPVDPGVLEVAASAPERQAWSHRLQATEGTITTIDVPVLAPLPRAAPPSPAPVVDVAPVADVAPAAIPPFRIAEGDRGARRARHVIGASIVVVGVAALGGGAYFGVAASGHWQDAKDACGGVISACPGDTVATSQRAVDDARSAAKLSLIMVAAGGAAIVLGALVWRSAPGAGHRIALSPVLDERAAGIALGGRF